MAKSLRAKAKMAGRRKKRESGNYHAVDVARTARLSARLLDKRAKKDEGAGADAEGDEGMAGEGEEEEVVEGEEEMKEEPKKISTSGPRETRREKWRESKGMSSRPKVRGMNRAGTATARTKAGRAKRRR